MCYNLVCALNFEMHEQKKIGICVDFATNYVNGVRYIYPQAVKIISHSLMTKAMEIVTKKKHQKDMRKNKDNFRF